MIVENGKCAICEKPLEKDRLFICQECQNNIKLVHRRDLSCCIFVDSDTEKPHIFKLSDALGRCKRLGNDLAICESNFGFPLVEVYIDNDTLNKIPKEIFKHIEDRQIYMATMGVLTFVSFYNGGEVE